MQTKDEPRMCDRQVYLRVCMSLSMQMCIHVCLQARMNAWMGKHFRLQLTNKYQIVEVVISSTLKEIVTAYDQS